MPSQGYLQADWRREAIRTNLWVVPAIEAVAFLLLFVGTTILVASVLAYRRLFTERAQLRSELLV